jgi:LmbE family N-acetylglucosaminyl deacetylase
VGEDDGDGATAAARAVRHDPEASAVLLSPHLDDAVWSCYSVLVDARPAVVVNVCAGVPTPGDPPPWDRACGARERAGHVRRRIAEDRAALARLGRDAVYLPVLDQQYLDGRAATAAEALTGLARAVGAASRVLACGGIDGHPDHILVRDMGVALLRAGMPVTFYADYSYCTRRGWPTWVDPDAGSGDADEQWREALGGVPGLDLAAPRIERVDADTAAAKLASMRDYRTQYDAIEQEEPRWQRDGRPPSDPDKRAIEVFYDVEPASQR